ncbi:MAG TPA: flagellar biosynthetic protein FliR [Kofleriaceae bacterium]|nr:flagellar biosynthetic protein FliR [Kofleriaceae bacterium]
MTVSQAEIGAVLVTLARATGLAATAPVIGEAGVSMRARLVFVIAVSLAVGFDRAPVELGDVPGTAGLELATGLLVGLIASFVLARVAVAGQLIGLSLGLGFASQYDVHAGESAGTTRQLATTLGGLAFVMAGGLEAVVKSVAAAPADVSHLASLGPELVRQGCAAFPAGVALAAPIVLAALASHVGLAIMNRAAPAVNMFSLALACTLIVGGFVLLVSAAHLVGGATDAAKLAIDALGR